MHECKYVTCHCITERGREVGKIETNMKIGVKMETRTRFCSLKAFWLASSPSICKLIIVEKNKKGTLWIRVFVFKYRFNYHFNHPNSIKVDGGEIRIKLRPVTA